MTLLRDGRYRGPLYRALNPVYAREPLSGRGARLYGGRFNRKGTPALYTALAPTTALREANQVGTLQPTDLVSYRADLGPIFDSCDTAAIAAYGTNVEALADPGWRSAMLNRRLAPTQVLAESLVADGFVGMLFRSFADGASRDNLNLVLWRWMAEDCALEVVDDENRLWRM